MVNKSLMYLVVGVAAGSLITVAGSSIVNKDSGTPQSNSSSMSMMDMSKVLEGKTGDEFDKVFIAEMIAHHEGAVAMAKQAEASAKHDEIKALSKDIITAQESEITKMKQWQQMWGYDKDQMSGMDHSSMKMN